MAHWSEKPDAIRYGVIQVLRNARGALQGGGGELMPALRNALYFCRLHFLRCTRAGIALVYPAPHSVSHVLVIAINFKLVI